MSFFFGARRCGGTGRRRSCDGRRSPSCRHTRERRWRRRDPGPREVGGRRPSSTKIERKPTPRDPPARRRLRRPPRERRASANARRRRGWRASASPLPHGGAGPLDLLQVPARSRSWFCMCAHTRRPGSCQARVSRRVGQEQQSARDARSSAGRIGPLPRRPSARLDTAQRAGARVGHRPAHRDLRRTVGGGSTRRGRATRSPAPHAAPHDAPQHPAQRPDDAAGDEQQPEPGEVRRREAEGRRATGDEQEAARRRPRGGQRDAAAQAHLGGITASSACAPGTRSAAA